jgi:chemotaxis family two-component system sensor kinase Cph1
MHEDFKRNISRLAKILQEKDNIKEALLLEPANLLSVVQSKGAVVVYGNDISKIGLTPDDEQLNGLVHWIKENVTEQIYHTTSLRASYPPAEAFRAIASGVMVCVLSKKLGEYIIWFKPEQIHHVTWAGNPDKPVVLGENGLLNISPRHSFASWEQTISGTSVDWRVEEIISVTQLKEEITNAINVKANTIRTMNERLRLAYEELETFSYTISHDLKSPIASIKSYAQLLIRDEMVLDRGQKMIHRIADRADQMNLMINAILDYSRIGRSDIEYRKINAGTLIDDIVKDLALIYNASNLQVTIGETPDLFGDPIMMLQVFSNLIGNAAKYSGQNGQSIIHIEGHMDETNIVYTIKDNGRGIAKEDIPKIFELFNRMNNVQDIEGSGVGLAIVKRIIEKHKGFVWAESELNVGSTFYVSFNKTH